MATLFHQGKLPTLHIGDVDRAFFGSSEYADDSTNGCSLLKEWQEIDNESSPRVENQGCSHMKSFGSACIDVAVRFFVLSSPVNHRYYIPWPAISVPVVRKRRLIDFSFLLISRQMSSTTRIKLVSAFMK